MQHAMPKAYVLRAPVHACAGVSGCVLNRFCANLRSFGRFPFRDGRGGLFEYSTQPTYFPKITPFKTSGCHE